MEDLAVSSPDFWSGKRVFITGHTGFKGGWLSLWLTQLNAQVFGYALHPPTSPCFFEICDIKPSLSGHYIADIRDRTNLEAALRETQPDIIFHLAAQPLVRHSYQDPIFTFETNTVGTLNLLEAARSLGSVRAIINVTSDKCYENRETTIPYSEQDSLGGHDIYSASKACSEIISASYRRSFTAPSNPRIATARAGNVIGGGDWSPDRLVPDFFRAMSAGQTVPIRNPESVRPWQHVLEVLRGYLLLGEKLFTEGESFAEAWNFGPNPNDSKSVKWIVSKLCSLIEGTSFLISPDSTFHEAQLLSLDSSKSQQRLQWYPAWNLETALEKTTSWHLAYQRQMNMREFSLAQIESFQQNHVSSI